jgi:glutamyl-tRNA reductase
LQAAEEFAQTVNGSALPLDQFRTQPCEVAALVLAAGGSEPIFDVSTLTRLTQSTTRAPLIIDFGVPPNVDPEAARLAGLPRVGMNDLIQVAQERRPSQLMRLAPVRAAIDDRLMRLRGDFATRAIGRKLADLRGTFEQIAAEEVDRALATELRGLDATQREILQRLGETVARRLAHLPLAGLRAAAAHASPDAVEAFFREAKLTRPLTK